MVFTATAASLLDGEAFNRLVAEEDLRVWEQEGYIYTKRKGKDGIELYRAYGPKWRWVWSYGQVCTQDNVAGGNLVVTITPASGQTMVNFYGRLTASGNRAGQADVYNADAATICNIASIGAVASCTVPFAPTASGATTSNAPQQVTMNGVTNPEYIRAVIVAAAQTETATLMLHAILTSSTAPTVSWAGSGGTPNAAAATENTVTAVLMP